MGCSLKPSGTVKSRAQEHKSPLCWQLLLDRSFQLDTTNGTAGCRLNSSHGVHWASHHEIVDDSHAIEHFQYPLLATSSCWHHVPVAAVVEANRDLLNSDSTVTTFALTLARESFFGEDVMVQCTSHGYGDTPGLPLLELLQLKEEVRRHYPKYWNSPQEFELKWKACTESISQGCKRMRKKSLKKKWTIQHKNNIMSYLYIHVITYTSNL